jgi:phage baseplate assembly protein W
MPYKNLEISPDGVTTQNIRKQSQFYRGFTTTDENSQSTVLYDFELVQQDIINIFQTKKGERVMNPDFGTIIWGLIYEPFTDNVKQLISEDISRILNSDPRVTPTRIVITEAEYGMIVEATLYYKLQDVSQQMTLTFDKALGLVTQ